jgi:DHA1 family bicyclomycin/chloramphenicol resistance-like MFS transporter
MVAATPPQLLDHPLFSRALLPSVARTHYAFVATLAALSAFAPMSVDMYLPAMPSLTSVFDATPGMVQWTLSAFLVGFGLGQLIFGPLADRFGRKPILLLGLSLYLLASAGCATAETVVGLMEWRFVQAIGACSGQVLARAMIRDVFDRDRAARMLSIMMLLMGAAPMLAPLIGGQLLAFFTWRAIFWVLVGFGALSIAGTLLVLDETLPPERRTASNLTQMLRTYGLLLRNRQLTGYIATTSLIYVGLFAYVSGSAFVFIEVYGVPRAQFGFLFGLNVVALMLGALINSRLVVRLGSDYLLRRGTLAGALTGLWLAADAALGIGGLTGIMIPLFCFMFSMSFVGANALAGGLSIFPQYAGTASALFGMLQFVTGGLCGSLVGMLHDGTARPMAFIIAIAGVAGLTAHRRLVKAEAA